MQDIQDSQLTRNPAVEALRYVGAVGIVWFHMEGPVSWVGHSALGVFIILSVVLTLSMGGAWSRKRVLKIWLFWSAIYAAMKVLQAVLHGTPIIDEFEWWMLVTGPSLPLWFLLFIYVANGFAAMYVKKVDWPPIFEGAVLGILSASLVVAVPTLPIPLSQWALGVAAVLAAIAVFRGIEGNWTVLAVWAAPILILGDRLFILAVPVATLALIYPAKAQQSWPNILGRLALPVYILHPGISSAASLDGSAEAAIIVAIISTILGAILIRMPVFRSYI